MSEDKFEAATQREISATTRWGVGMVAAMLMQACAIFFWAATMQAHVDQNSKDITSLQSKVESINDDIRNILVGIEQVKARLGIVEEK